MDPLESQNPTSQQKTKRPANKVGLQNRTVPNHTETSASRASTTNQQTETNANKTGVQESKAKQWK